MTRFFFRRFRRRAESARLDARRQEVERAFSAFHGRPARFVPVSGKGGYDQIYLVTEEGRTFAVARMNNPFKSPPDDVGPDDPVQPLPPAARLELEWESYARLFPLGLSPQPLWRADDCIVCSWLPWQRVSRLLVRQRELAWPFYEAGLDLVRRMHGAGVVHLDTNTGNFLTDETRRRLVIIDFEHGPAPGISADQARAFDFLRLTEDFARPRRGGRVLARDPGRLRALLERAVDEAARAAPLAVFQPQLRSIAAAPAFLAAVRDVFPRFDAPGPARPPRIP